MSRPRLLDLFCGAGGAAMGYSRAGFDVVGVDIAPQPHYPFEFHQADALAVLRALTDGSVTSPEWLWQPFDAIHASPPCQAYTTAGNGWKSRLGPSIERHPDMLGSVRMQLGKWDLPWVIENTPGAPMQDYVFLCGSMFGLGVRRHRWFESSFFIFGPPTCTDCTDPESDFVIVFGGGVRGRSHQIGRTIKGGPIIRRPTLPLKRGQEAMEIDWMNRDELSEAIPPAYTLWVGERLMEVVRVPPTATVSGTVQLS